MSHSNTPDYTLPVRQSAEEAECREGRINEIREELLDCRSRIDSLRIELQRMDNEINKIEHLRGVVWTERNSINKAFKVAYLALSCILPDIVKWVLRPLTRKARRLSRLVEGKGSVVPYRIKLASARHPRKRVLHAMANFMTGGSSRLVVDLVEGLGHRYEQEILTGFFPAPAAYQGIAVHERRNPYEIVALMKKFRPDMLHVHYWGDVDFAWYDKVFRAANRIGCKIVENVNTPVVPYRSELVQQYVYVSDYVMRRFGRSSEPNMVIHPGSDLGFFSRNSLYESPENCIGMVYRLEPDKLNLQSIDVFIEVAKRRPNTKMLIVGSGSLCGPYQEAALAHGVTDAFSFTGAIPYADLPDIYSQMSVFVAPVWKESFGQVSCFAMSMGIPVVGFRVGGLEEIIDDDALLVPSGASDKLADIIITLLNDRQMRCSIGERNRQRVQSLFSVEQMVKQYEILYSRVVSECK